MAFKLNKDKFNFGEGTGSSPNKIIPAVVGAIGLADLAYEGYKAYKKYKNKGIEKLSQKKLSDYSPKVQRIMQARFPEAYAKLKKKEEMENKKREELEKPMREKLDSMNIQKVDEKGNRLPSKKIVNNNNKTTKKTHSTNMKDFKIGSAARKAEYDRRGWKYDDTIAGYNRDGSKKN